VSARAEGIAPGRVPFADILDRSFPGRAAHREQENAATPASSDVDLLERVQNAVGLERRPAGQHLVRGSHPGRRHPRSAQSDVSRPRACSGGMYDGVPRIRAASGLSRIDIESLGRGPKSVILASRGRESPAFSNSRGPLVPGSPEGRWLAFRSRWQDAAGCERARRPSASGSKQTGGILRW